MRHQIHKMKGLSKQLRCPTWTSCTHITSLWKNPKKTRGFLTISVYFRWPPRDRFVGADRILVPCKLAACSAPRSEVYECNLSFAFPARSLETTSQNPQHNVSPDPPPRESERRICCDKGCNSGEFCRENFSKGAPLIPVTGRWPLQRNSIQAIVPRSTKGENSLHKFRS
jgi:hypothetical protein